MKVGFIGLGNVGAKLSGSLLRNGVDLTIHDLDEARVSDFVTRGATRGNSPADLMENCDIVITCLPSPMISAAVVDQMLPHVREGKIWLEMSTTDEAE
ncbi:MAG: NAD(P)-dependent oxidoreductase, partial [Rhodobacteraceae bacterium]|nr:NAD(P)-dependent oxidoreductase [Paracoccaceae bacterium]